jgi:hypothetical protein
MKHFTFIIAFFVLAQLVFSQDKNLVKYSNSITQKDLKKHLSIIASDAYEGRNTGEKGLEMAAKYIEKEFKGDKLIGPVKTSKDQFYQEFELEKKTWTKTNIIVGNTNYEQGKDAFLIEKMEGKNEYDLVFIGYGIYSDKYDDYKNLDVKGKMVVFMLGEPRTISGKYLVTNSDSASIKTDTTLMGKFSGEIQSKVMASIMRGAKGFIFVETNDKEAEKTMNTLNHYTGSSEMVFPGKSRDLFPIQLVCISPSVAAKMFGTNLKGFQDAIAEKIEKGESPSGLFNSKITIEAERKTETIKTGNVIGLIEGSDKKEEYIAIMGHYDHEGIKKGEIYNGTDDNGSGTVALIELAEAFAKAKAEGKGPRRSILFIALTGEEKGMLGSQYYSENPVIPMINTVTGLNIDMVGRVDKVHKDKGNYVYIIGDDRLSSELHTISESTTKLYFPDIVLDYTFNAKDHPEHLYERSDHYNFAQKGVPVIFYTSGLHDEYHTPKDDIELIDFPSYEKRVRLIFATAWQLANADEKVKVDK